jgi:hypothetical protein
VVGAVSAGLLALGGGALAAAVARRRGPHIPPPTALAEQWLYCLGLKALLNGRLDIEDDPGRRRLAYETWVEVLDPPIFLVRRRPSLN